MQRIRLKRTGWVLAYTRLTPLFHSERELFEDLPTKKTGNWIEILHLTRKVHNKPFATVQECKRTSMPPHVSTRPHTPQPARAHIFKNRLHITFDSKTYVTRFIVEVYRPLGFRDGASYAP